jgi:hypothetical protein
MSAHKMKFFGWCLEKDASGKATHDKIWGIISAQGEWVTFWGRRDKSLTFKRGRDYPDLDKTIREKEGKGYTNTSMEEMNAIDPEFEQRFEEALILAMMADKYHVSPYV